jgi:hypothetical protein
MKLFSIAAVLSVAFGVCAYAAPYGASDISTSQIDPATLQITARNDAHSTPETIQRYVLRRAAEETSERGFDLFLLLPSSRDLNTMPAPSGAIAAIAPDNARESVLVMMFHGEKPSNAPGNLYRAIDVLEPIRPFASALSRN